MRLCLLCWLAALLAAPVLHAQNPRPGPPDPAALDELRRRAEPMMNPVAFALEHRAELGITDAQAAQLEPAAARLRELQDATVRRSRELLGPLFPGMTDPREAVDAEAVRAAYREKAELEAEVAIAMMEVRRLVAQTLGAEQREQLQRLQMAAALELMRSLPALTPR